MATLLPGTLEDGNAGALEVGLGLLVVGAHQSDGIDVGRHELVPHHDEDADTLLGLLLEDLAQRLPLLLGVVLPHQLEFGPDGPAPDVDELLGVLDGPFGVDPQLGRIVWLSVAGDDVGDRADLGSVRILVGAVAAPGPEGEDDVGHLVGRREFVGGNEAQMNLQLAGRLARLALEGIPSLELLLGQHVLDADGHAAHKVRRHQIQVLDGEEERIGLVAKADVERFAPRGIQIVVDDGRLDEAGRLLAPGDRVDGNVRVRHVELS